MRLIGLAVALVLRILSKPRIPIWGSTLGCIVTLTLSMLVASLVAEAQQPTKGHRIGWLMADFHPSSSTVTLQAREEAFACTACPEFVIDDAGVTIGEVGNQVILNKEEWNVLVDLIAAGQLTRQ